MKRIIGSFISVLLLSGLAQASEEVLPKGKNRVVTTAPVSIMKTIPCLESSNMVCYFTAIPETKNPRLLALYWQPHIKRLMGGVVEAQNQVASRLFRLADTPVEISTEVNFDVLAEDGTVLNPKAFMEDLEKRFKADPQGDFGEQMRLVLFEMMLTLQLMAKQLDALPSYKSDLNGNNLFALQAAEIDKRVARTYSEYCACFHPLLLSELRDLRHVALVSSLEEIKAGSMPYNFLNKSLMTGDSENRDLWIRYLGLWTGMLVYLTDANQRKPFVNALIERRVYRFRAETGLSPLILPLKAHNDLQNSFSNPFNTRIQELRELEKQLIDENGHVNEQISMLQASNRAFLDSQKSAQKLPANVDQLLLDQRAALKQLEDTIAETKRENEALRKNIKAKRKEIEQVEIEAQQQAKSDAHRLALEGIIKQLSDQLAQGQAELSKLKAELSEEKRLLETMTEEHLNKTEKVQQQLATFQCTRADRQAEFWELKANFEQAEKEAVVQAQQLPVELNQLTQHDHDTLQQEEDEIRQLEEQLVALDGINQMTYQLLEKKSEQQQLIQADIKAAEEASGQVETQKQRLQAILSQLTWQEGQQHDAISGQEKIYQAVLEKVACNQARATAALARKAAADKLLSDIMAKPAQILGSVGYHCQTEDKHEAILPFGVAILIAGNALLQLDAPEASQEN
jgi:hypothetical protein